MGWLVQPRLVNEPVGDPGVFVDFRFGRRALLFDLGDLAPLSARELMRVSHAFVSHTHMDHFGGFDRLLRTCLHRTAPLHLVGPPGFIDQVEHKLRAYTWNLLDATSIDFRLTAAEFDGRLGSAAQFRAREAFRRRDEPFSPGRPGLVLEEEAFRVEAAMLDHGITSLAFALREELRVNVWRGSLEALGLTAGPWLNAAKRAVVQRLPDETSIQVSPDRSIRLADLRENALRVGPGQVVAYVTDAACHTENAAKIVALARDADQLFIEAVLLHRDAALAAQKGHMTATQAGRLARQAGAKHVVPFHFSPRYGNPEDLRREIEAAFTGQSLP